MPARNTPQELENLNAAFRAMRSAIRTPGDPWGEEYDWWYGGMVYYCFSHITLFNWRVPCKYQIMTPGEAPQFINYCFGFSGVDVEVIVG